MSLKTEFPGQQLSHRMVGRNTQATASRSRRTTDSIRGVSKTRIGGRREVLGNTRVCVKATFDLAGGFERERERRREGVSRWTDAPIKFARMTLTTKLDENWNIFQIANSAPPLSVTDSAAALSARIHLKLGPLGRADVC